MSTLTAQNPSATTDAAPGLPAPLPASGSGLSFGGILRSEWIKLRSLRSTVWSFALVIVVSLGMALLMSTPTASVDNMVFPEEQQLGIVLSATTFGIFFGQMIVAVLGVISVTGEYSTGMIKSTLTAVPRRLPALAAKMIVMFVATFIVGVISTVGSYFVASLLLAGNDISADLFDPLLLQGVFGGALYLGLIAVFAQGIGAILRSSAGGIALALGILLVLPLVLSMIPGEWPDDVGPYLLSNAGVEIFMQTGFSVIEESWQNLLVTLGWVAVSLGLAGLLLKSRDA
ncbi:ABC transporter permease [Cryobacterium melibiosiphilum]|uniref:ABC transporter permease n=1 Tax=Cryobacterium melibiosiphilum TaxID=995039 RepID=A0A3A5MWK3_9MICO|nr:ABC transporter permease [Cryobacterium melibiosiphilum]RJT89574.1 ABC transporter permease [Cryobacterium melibiosiphilum]